MKIAMHSSAWGTPWGARLSLAITIVFFSDLSNIHHEDYDRRNAYYNRCIRILDNLGYRF